MRGRSLSWTQYWSRLPKAHTRRIAVFPKGSFSECESRVSCWNSECSARYRTVALVPELYFEIINHTPESFSHKQPSAHKVGGSQKTWPVPEFLRDIHFSATDRDTGSWRAALQSAGWSLRSRAYSLHRKFLTEISYWKQRKVPDYRKS